MGLKDLFDFKKASKTVEAAKKDVRRPRDQVADQRKKKQGGGTR